MQIALLRCAEPIGAPVGGGRSRRRAPTRGRVSKDGGVPMNRQIIAGIVGLAFAGCAQTWPAGPVSRTDSRMPPVSATPVPTIDEANSRESPRLDPASLHAENGPVLTNLGAAPVAPPAVPAQVPTTSTTPEMAVRPISRAPGGADPAPSRLPTAASDPLLGTEPEVVPLSALAPPQDATAGALPRASAPPAAGIRPESSR
jgi:hypothetical protein